MNKKDDIIPTKLGSYDDANRPRHLKVTQLWAKQKRILQLVSLGYTNKEVAELMDVNVSTVNYLTKSELGKMYLNLLQAASEVEAINVRRAIEELAPLALAIQTEILTSENSSPALKVKIADSFLDRAGHSPTQKRVNVDIGLYNGEDLSAIKSRAKEIEAVWKREVGPNES